MQATDEGSIEEAMDGASNGSGSNGRYNNLSLIYMSEYDTIKIIIVLHEFKNNNNNGIKKINCLYNGLVQSVPYLDLLVHYDLHYIGLVDCWSHYPEKE
jgi:hypothetical protein